MITPQPTFTVKVSIAIHRDEKRYILAYPNNYEINKRVRRVPGRRFSGTRKQWHLPYTKEALDALRSQGITVIPDNKKPVSPHQSNTSPSTRASITQIENDTPPRKYEVTLSETDMAHITHFQEYLKRRRYAESTIDAYIKVIKLFYVWKKRHGITAIDRSIIERFNTDYFISGKYSRSYQNIFINAIKLMHEKGDLPNVDVYEIERPKRTSYLPDVLSEEEARQLIRSYRNLKHQTIIMMYYACGMRKSELINLKITDIDSKRGVIHIRHSKGSKDRNVPLPGPLLRQLRIYFYKYRPKMYLFNSASSLRYSPRSIDKILQKGLKRCNIKKRITIHNLRHSYATHLVEHNINLRYIQDALGHKSSKTTEIYTRLSKENIAKMVSPLDFWELDNQNKNTSKGTDYTPKH